MKPELNWYPAGSKYNAPYLAGEGLDHVAFCVDRIKDRFKELADKGTGSTEFTPEVDATHCCMKDPDDNWIELYQRSKPTSDYIPKGY